MCINIIQICVASLFSFFSSNWLSTWRRRWLNQLWLKECIDRLSLPWSSLGIIVIEPPFFRNNFKGSQAHNISLNFCLFPVELMICFEQQLFTLIKLVSGFEAIAKRYATHSANFDEKVHKPQSKSYGKICNFFLHIFYEFEYLYICITTFWGLRDSKGPILMY
jgi:hypothetical protein